MNRLYVVILFAAGFLLLWIPTDSIPLLEDPSNDDAQLALEPYSCQNRPPYSMVADVGSGCQAFHVCLQRPDKSPQDLRFQCPNGTLFNQQSETCTEETDVDCYKNAQLFSKLKTTPERKLLIIPEDRQKRDVRGRDDDDLMAEASVHQLIMDGYPLDDEVFAEASLMQNYVNFEKRDAKKQRGPPTFNPEELPYTDFSCYGKVIGGYYADPETDCQMFHVCQYTHTGEVIDTRLLCPNLTVFDQSLFVCNDWRRVDCPSATKFYDRNFELFVIPVTKRSPQSL